MKTAALPLSALLLSATCLGGAPRPAADPMHLSPGRAADEWSLWTDSTQLRGANTWQKREPSGEVYPSYAPADLAKLASWGANYVNLSLPGIYTESPTTGQYGLDSAAWENLDAMVTMAESAGLFVVVSFRTGPGRSEFVFDTSESPAVVNLWATPAAQDGWVAMWQETARRLKNRRVVVGYDLMVEPLLEPERDSVPAAKPEDWYRLAERIVAAIRSEDPTTPILLSVAPGGDPDSLANLNPSRFNPGANRVVFTFHQYSPFEYSHQLTRHSLFDCASGQPLGEEVDPPRTYDAAVRMRIQQVYTEAKNWKRTHRVEVAVNELGVTRWAAGADSFMRDQLRRVEEELEANHALWVWDPEECLGWDQMNFRNGPDPANHREDPQSSLARTIRSWWTTKNTVRP